MFEYKEKGHKYFLDGKPMTGVTTILGVIAKPALIQWAANMAVDYAIENAIDKGTQDEVPYYTINADTLKQARTAHAKKKTDAGKKGTDVHALCEDWIKTGALPEEPNEQFANFTEWLKTENIKVLESEKRMYHPDLFIAGTCDLVFEKDGKRYVGDIKTSSGIYYEAFIQMAGYSIMLEQMGEKFDGYCVVNLRKDGKMEVQYRYDMETDKGAFMAALTLYRAINTYKI